MLSPEGPRITLSIRTSFDAQTWPEKLGPRVDRVRPSRNYVCAWVPSVSVVDDAGLGTRPLLLMVVPSWFVKKEVRLEAVHYHPELSYKFIFSVLNLYQIRLYQCWVICI